MVLIDTTSMPGIVGEALYASRNVIFSTDVTGIAWPLYRETEGPRSEEMWLEIWESAFQPGDCSLFPAPVPPTHLTGLTHRHITPWLSS